MKKIIFLIAMICISLSSYAGETQSSSSSCSTSQSSYEPKYQACSGTNHIYMIFQDGTWSKNYNKRFTIYKDQKNKRYIEIDILDDRVPITRNRSAKFKGHRVSKYKYVAKFWRKKPNTAIKEYYYAFFNY